MTRHYTHIDIEAARNALDVNRNEVTVRKIKALPEKLQDDELRQKVLDALR
ncbi:MAG: hypothetical protein HRT88_02470 [Lentisphaeraceae bacterium]|nr:hypothetical protein [Lentisphaeraceae bacterium]